MNDIEKNCDYFFSNIDDVWSIEVFNIVSGFCVLYDMLFGDFIKVMGNFIDFNLFKINDKYDLLRFKKVC